MSHLLSLMHCRLAHAEAGRAARRHAVGPLWLARHAGPRRSHVGFLDPYVYLGAAPSTLIVRLHVSCSPAVSLSMLAKLPTCQLCRSGVALK